MNHLAAVGLIYDIAGVVVLAYGILRISTAEIVAEAGKFWSTEFGRSLVEQRADALTRLPCLMLGFVMQFLGTVGWLAPHSPWWWMALVVLVSGVAFYVSWLRPRHLGRHAAILAKLAGD